MDRKNFFLGMACIVGAFALFFLTKPATPPPGATPDPETRDYSAVFGLKTRV
jgi:hypothetical protein